MADPFQVVEDHGQLDAAQRTFSQLATDLSTSERSVKTHVTQAITDWNGQRSQTFVQGAGGVQIQLRSAHKGFAGLADVLREYAASVAHTQTELDQLRRQHEQATTALTHHASSGDAPGGGDGLATDLMNQTRDRRMMNAAAQQAQLAKADLARKAGSYAARIQTLTDQIAPASDHLSEKDIRREVTDGLQLGGMHGTTVTSVKQALALLDSAQAAAPPGSVNADGTVNWDKTTPADVPMPGKGSTPPEVNAWWRGLSPQEQNYLLQHHPTTIGNTDGIPCIDRDDANRRNLAAYLATLRDQQKTAAELGLPASEIFEMPPGTSYDSFVTLQKALGNSADDSNTYLLGFQPDEGQGHAITSYGNPDTATNVSTFVGGMTTDLGDLPEYMKHSYDTAAWMRRYGATSPAAVTWWGYDAPPGLTGAMSKDRAKDAAPALDGFQSGLRATHRGERSVNMVVGHSYGSLVVGEAASHGRMLDADNVVFMGSPGVGVDSVHDLHLTGVPDSHIGDHVFETRAENDVISAADDTLLGADPYSEQFGGTQFKSDAGPQLWGLFVSPAAHVSYWSYRNKCIVNLGSIGAGRGVAFGTTPPPDPTDIRRAK